MANPGQSNDPPIAPGTKKWREYEALGFRQDQLIEWKEKKTQEYREAGFSQEKIDAYWGAGRSDTNHAKTLAQINLSRAKPSGNAWEDIQAGFGVTAAGLLQSGGAPKYVLPKDANIFSKTLSALGQVAGDAPIAIPAFIAAAPGGAAIGGAVGGVFGLGAGAAPGAVIGGLATGGFAAGAAPIAARETVINAYAAGEIDNPDELWARVTHSTVETLKGGAVGLITAPVGGAVGGKVAAATGKAVFGSAADVTTQAVGGAALGGALNGQMPTRDDFVVGLVTGLATEAAPLIIRTRKGQPELTEGGKYMKHNAEKIYTRTGVPPRESGRRAASNPALAQERIQQNVYGDPVIPRHMDEAPPEVEPYKAAPEPGAEAAPQKFGGTRETVDAASKLIGEKEGLREEAYWDVNHWRVGYGSDTVTNPDGTYRKTVKGDVIDKAAADRDRARRISQQFLPAAREDVGTQWHALPTDAQAALVSVAYNYGRLPTNVVRAARTGDVELIAQAVEKLQFHNGGVNKQRRLDEANMIRGGGGGKKPPGGEGPPAGGEGGPVVPFGKRRQALTDPAAEAAQRAKEEAAWSAKSAEDRYKAAMEMVGDPKKDGLLDLFDPDLVIDQYVSELRPARLLDNQIFEAHPDFDRKRTYGVEDAFRNTYASDDRAALFLKHGPVDGETNEFIGTKESPSLDLAVKQLKKAGGNVEDFRGYMLALRTVEKEGQGIKTGMDPALARSIALDPKEFAKYKEAVATFQKVGHGIFQYAIAKGRYSPEQVKRMVKQNLFWVSMRRVQGDHEAFSTSSKFGHFKVGPGIRKMEGSDLQVVDPIMASIDNWRMIVADADRNEAAGVVVRAAEGGLIPPEWGIEKVEDLLADPNASTELAPYAGMGHNGGPELDALTEALAPDLAVKTFKARGSTTEFLWFRDGKPEVWKTKSEALARLLQGAESAGEANLILAALQGVAAVKRAGITSLPDFALKTMFSDQLGAFVTDPLHPPPFLTLALGAFPALTHNKTWKAWVASGGAGASAVAMDRNFLSRDMAKLFDETGFSDKVWNAAKHPLSGLQMIQERVDTAQRIGHFIYSQKVGKMEPRRAAMQGRKTYIDFKEKGTLQLVNTWAKVTPFLRPYLLATKNTGEAAATDLLNSALALGVIGGVAVGFALMNQHNDEHLPDRDKWSNMADWKKDGYLTTPDINGFRIKIATRDIIGAVNALTWRTVSFLKDHDKHAYDGLAAYFAKTFLFDLTPAAAQPVLEDRANYSFFMDRPLVPTSLEGATGPAQYTENTTETAKKLAKWLGNEENPLSILNVAKESPIIIDNYIRGLTGSAGIEVARILDPKDPATSAPPAVTDNPFVASFIHRETKADAAPISDFYDRYEKVQAAKTDMRLAQKRGDREELLDARSSPYAGVSVDGVAAALKQQRNMLDRINKNKQMTVDEKRQYSERTYVRMIATAQRGLDVMNYAEERAAEREARVQARQQALDTAAPAAPSAPAQAPAQPPVAPLAGQMALN